MYLFGMNRPMKPTDLLLNLRFGLPDALRVLLDEYPRQGWVSHPSYQGLISFWLDRHMIFRKLMEKLQEDAVACEAGKLDAEQHKVQLARFGSMFVGELHGHHNIEDAHYFPVLKQKDPRIAAGFELLDKDHHALDAHLNAFVQHANGVLQPSNDIAGALERFIDNAHKLDRLLNRHLTDEEEVVVPVILKYGTGGLA
jgi:hemerythrin-like domain-containing protein